MNEGNTASGYDIIGDVHGCAQTLANLLETMGYRKQGGVYSHPNRQAVFVGDIVDRGPRIREALHLVHDMVSSGKAHMVIGNHEYDALGYTTHIDERDDYLRRHTPRHNRLISETLEQFAAYPDEWKAFLGWFQSLPLFLEFEHFRVVHACWDDELIRAYRAQYQSHHFDREFLCASADKKSFAGILMNRLTKGVELRLPEGVSIKGGDGYTRKHFRTKFWSQVPRTYGDVVFQPDPLPEDVAQSSISDSDRQRLVNYPTDAKPLFIGHYWLKGRPRPLNHNVACLDYSAVKYGKLVAYRMDGERELQADKFVWVYVERP